MRDLKNSLTTQKTNLDMCRALEAIVKPGIKSKIVVGRNPVNITTHSILFTYDFEGHVKNYELDLEDAGEVLLNAGIISRFEGTTFYKKRIVTVEGKDGTPLMWAVETEVDVKDIKFTADDVIHLMADWEYEKIGRFMGLVDYKPKAIRRSINSLKHAM
jgi:hypothetical protein